MTIVEYPETADFLGVARSCGDRRWRAREADPLVVQAHKTRLGISEPLARAMASRGVSPEAGEQFLHPTLGASFPDPSSFADMDRATAILLDALASHRRMVVFADYDVDGACSAALLVRWYRAMGYELPIYVPDRLTEGYGPSPTAFRRLRTNGAELAITVDCGAAAHDAIDEARRIGLDVIVVDHHLMRDARLDAAAVVNPNRPDCTSGQGVLSAAGVTFVLLAALNREARRRGLFGGRREPDPRQWLDLVALASICDVTRLVGFNRALTIKGLQMMSHWRNPGLSALMNVAGIAKAQAGVFEAGFVLGPRVNAGGRVGRADLGARLLSTDDEAEAGELARRLDALNTERKAVETDIVGAAERLIEQDAACDRDSAAIIVADDGWHPGVIGIVASRLRERYRKPVIVVAVDKPGDIAKGSGRSRPGVNLGRAIQSAVDAGILLAGGGHPMAAGLTMRPSAIADLRRFLDHHLSAETAAANSADALDIDLLVSPAAATRSLIDEFQQLAPFGPGNPEPMYALANVRVERSFPMRGGHMRCDLVGPGGAGVKTVAWRCEGTEIGRRLAAAGLSLHVAGRLRPDDWNGRGGVQLEVEDVADAGRNRPVV